MGFSVGNAVTGSVAGGIIGGGAGSIAGGVHGGLGDINSLLNTVTGKSAGDAAREAANIQSEAIDRGIATLDPYNQAGQAALPGLTSLVTDPAAQLDFLQNNPMFEAMRNQSTRELLNTQATRGKLGAGETPAALQERFLGLGTNLIGQQIGHLQGLAGMGGQTAGTIADLIGSQGAAQAAGIVGEQQARTNALNQMMQAGALAISDIRFKKDIKKIDEKYGLPVYSFKYIWDDEEQIGFMAHEVRELFPEAVKEIGNVLYVDYGAIYAH